MKIPEISQSLYELGKLKTKGTVVTCAEGPLTRAVRGQLASVKSIAQALAARGPFLVVDAGDDDATLAKLSDLLGDNAVGARIPATIIANIADRSLSRAIENRFFADKMYPRPVLVSEAQLVAGRAIAQARLFQIAKWRNQPRLNVAILGYGPLARALLEEILLDGIAAGLDAPQIEIITRDAGAARASLEREMPEIAQSAQIRIAPLIFEELGDVATSPLAKAGDENPLTAIFLALDNAKDNLRAAAEICALQELHGQAHAATFIGGAGAETATRLVVPRRPSRNLGLSISKLEELQDLPHLLQTIVQGRDVVAKRLHETYEGQYAGQTGAGTSWENLPETYRRANRRAASHLVQKLDLLGIDMSLEQQSTGAVDHYAYDNLIVPLTKSTVEDKTMRDLARLEHERWCADRRIDGWRFGEIRDDSRRLHPSLVAFDDPRLTADEIGKDVSQLRFLLGSVVKPEAGGATRGLSVGVVAGSGQPGIDAASLRERFQLEPERSIILISPLLTKEEVTAVASLLGELRKMKRQARLVIPEWFANNATLREVKLDQSETMQALIADERIWIAPIGPQRFSASTEWDEVSVTEGHRQKLFDYVTRRSDVLLAVLDGA